MKKYFSGIYYSFPVQLLALQFRKHQILLLFWIILIRTIDSKFLHTFGADSLFLAPEYLGDVNAIGAAIVGVSMGMLIMSWNITGFILFSNHIKFLAATTNPFLKYCINNFCIPLFFILFYFIKAWQFDRYKELIPPLEIFFLAIGFLCGFIFLLTVTFIYFFQADRTILRQMMPQINNPKEFSAFLNPEVGASANSNLIRVRWYLDSPWRVLPARDVTHYTQNFIESILKRHHFAAILSILFAFFFLIVIGFLEDFRFFQLPAAACITVLFTVLMGVFGVLSYFLKTWSIPFFVLLLLAINIFYQQGWIDPRNKAYGLNYENKNDRPLYNRENLVALSAAENCTADSLKMIQILEKWKIKQATEKPLMVMLSCSGGGHRSASFSFNILQQLDSITGGDFMKKTVLITGASGGMTGAAYFKELYWRRQKKEPINLQSDKYEQDIASDLLNPLFTAFVARDIISPAIKYKIGTYEYVKDRAYAFESKLNESTNGFLDKRLWDYREAEENAEIPLTFFSSVITRDAKQVLISTQPLRYMMKGRYDSSRFQNADPDVIDFVSFFKNQDPYNLRLLSASRMNATFPIALPNVWLPSNPVIDVMDAGIRDNYGTETTLRFLQYFQDWILQNTGGVLLLQIRDRPSGGWSDPYSSNNLSDHFTKPFLVLQHKWSQMQEYSQNNMVSLYSKNQGYDIHTISFQYEPEIAEDKVALSFHLTQREKQQIRKSVLSPHNQKSFFELLRVLKK